MEKPADEEMEKAANEIADFLLNDWKECQEKLGDDDDREELFKFWIVEKLARALVAAGSFPSGTTKPYPINRI